MSSVLLLILGGAAAAAAAAATAGRGGAGHLGVHQHEWESFKLVHRKRYASIAEEWHRMGVFADNLRRIHEHNAAAAAGRYSYTLAMNHLGDLSEAEFRQYVAKFNSTRRSDRSRRPLHAVSSAELPESKDWREAGLVTPVKDQGVCGSCWSFSATGAIEAAAARATGQLVSLSEQNLMDCSRPQGNLGCTGGDMDAAFDYVVANGGVATEASYPYEGWTEFSCRYGAAAPGANISGHVDVLSGDETALKSALASVGPVSVAIDASRFSFQFYSDGVYDEAECSSTELDHGVLAVGYGSEQGVDYWIVKNSWGTVWGRQGYIYMARNKQNQCGIASTASYPVV